MMCLPFFHKDYKWYDVLIFNYGGSYLLQGRKCDRCGKTTFRSPKTTGFFTPGEYNRITTKETMEDGGLWEVSPS